MILLTEAQKEQRQSELKDAKYGRFDDVVSIVGTGEFADMPKDEVYTRVHKDVAKKLIEKGYAKAAV